MKTKSEIAKKELNYFVEDLKYLRQYNYPMYIKSFKTPGWALPYIQAEVAIPKEFRSDFYDELVNEDLGYRKELEDSVRYFGVRFN